MSDLLLDTCAVLWLAEGIDMSAEARAAITKQKLHISPISAWEIANLVRKQRIALTLPVVTWFHRLVEQIDAALPQLDPEILIESCALPGMPPADPADRIIIAAARHAGLTVVTRDRFILDYSRAGHVRALAC